MTQAQQPEALRLSAWLQDGTFHHMTLGDAILAGRELRSQHARLAELEAENAALKAAPECLTCNDNGAVGNILTAEPCLDCTPKAAPAAQAVDEVPESVLDAVAEALGDAYDCGRVWSAWGVGTMSADDFSPVADDSDRVAEIARAAITADRAQRAASAAQGEA